MNVLLIAAGENDVEPISKNIELYNDMQRKNLFFEACTWASFKVINFLLPTISSSICLDEVAFVLSSKKNRYSVLNHLVEKGIFCNQACFSGLLLCISDNDTQSFNLLLQYGSKDNRGICLRQAIAKKNFYMFRALWPEDNLFDHKLFVLALNVGCPDIAFFIYEKKPEVLDDVKLRKGRREMFLRYKKILYKARVRAVNKIGTWWIPICYDLSRECGIRMREKIWKKIETFMDGFEF